MPYRVTKRAEAEVDAICDYIASDNVDAAQRLNDRFHREMGHLADAPGMGHERPDVRNPRYRFWPVGNYVIAYRVEKGAVVVSRVILGARDFRKLFKR